MVKNFGKGGSGAKRMKNSTTHVTHRELLFKQTGQDYALVTDLLGHGRCRVLLSESPSVPRLAIIRGNMRKGAVNRVRPRDLVLVSLRDFQEDKVDIVHLYQPTEARQLQLYNELSEDFVARCASHDVVTTNTNQDTDVFVQFGDIESL